ncbi:MAG: serpin family protein [Ruminococcus sp.]|nr:serpin family protein [Ruminococcus sp.]
MKKLKALAAAVAAVTVAGIFSSCSSAETNNTPAETAAETERVQAEAVYSTEEIFGSFNGAFLKEYLREQDSFVISPLSAKLALSMAAAGADRGSATEKELLDLFGYGTKEDMLADCGKIISELDSSKTISTANSAWLSDRLKGLNDGYSDTLKDVFSAERFSEDLSSNSFVKKFNKWVDKNTKGMIPQLLNSPLSEDARLALVNALYFKNEWVYKFDKQSTHDRDFNGKSGTVQVPTMYMVEHLQYGEGKRFKSVTLPYGDGSYMRVYLPLDENTQIADLIAEMSIDELNAEFETEYERKNIVLAMPKFECESGGSLVKMFERLGVREAFAPGSASFGGITDDKDVILFISEIIQAAKIICDEEGTEAAAATMVTMDGGADMVTEEPMEFIVDRPFLYEIKTASGETLFMGVMQDINT